MVDAVEKKNRGFEKLVRASGESAKFSQKDDDALSRRFITRAVDFLMSHGKFDRTKRASGGA